MATRRHILIAPPAKSKTVRTFYTGCRRSGAPGTLHLSSGLSQNGAARPICWKLQWIALVGSCFPQCIQEHIQIPCPDIPGGSRRRSRQSLQDHTLRPIRHPCAAQRRRLHREVNATNVLVYWNLQGIALIGVPDTQPTPRPKGLSVRDHSTAARGPSLQWVAPIRNHGPWARARARRGAHNATHA